MNKYQSQAAMQMASRILGEKWSLHVVNEIALGHVRFNQLAAALPQLSPTLISQRLKSLVRQSVIEKVTQGRHHVYHLSATGTQLVPVIQSLALWAENQQKDRLSAQAKDIEQAWQTDYDLIEKATGVIQFHTADVIEQRNWWVVLDGDQAHAVLCQPTQAESTVVHCSGEQLQQLLNGDVTARTWIQSVRVFGDRDLLQTFIAALSGTESTLVSTSSQWLDSGQHYQVSAQIN